MSEIPEWLTKLVEKSNDSDYNPDEIITISMRMAELLALRSVLTDVLYGEDPPPVGSEHAQNLRRLEDIVEDRWLA